MNAQSKCIQCSVELEESGSTLCNKCINLKEIDDLIKKQIEEDHDYFKNEMEKNIESYRQQFC